MSEYLHVQKPTFGRHLWWMTSRTPILCSIRITLLLKWIPYILTQ